MKRKREREHSRNIKVNRKADFEGYFSIYLKIKNKKLLLLDCIMKEQSVFLLSTVFGVQETSDL